MQIIKELEQQIIRNINNIKSKNFISPYDSIRRLLIIKFLFDNNIKSLFEIRDFYNHDLEYLIHSLKNQIEVANSDFIPLFEELLKRELNRLSAVDFNMDFKLSKIGKYYNFHHFNKIKINSYLTPQH
jgi:hypothetical protein